MSAMISISYVSSGEMSQLGARSHFCRLHGHSEQFHVAGCEGGGFLGHLCYWIERSVDVNRSEDWVLKGFKNCEMLQ